MESPTPATRVLKRVALFSTLDAWPLALAAAAVFLTGRLLRRVALHSWPVESE